MIANTILEDELNMTDEERKKCFYYDKNLEDGCFTCCECGIEKCPEAVKRMTDKEKRLYGIN